jgi:hypothetical protein
MKNTTKFLLQTQIQTLFKTLFKTLFQKTFCLLIVTLGLTISLSAHAKASKNSLLKLVGTYQTEAGGLVKVVAHGNTLAMRANFDLSGDESCQTQISSPVGASSDQDFAEIYFQLSKSNCPNIDGKVTLHFNVSLIGSDVYLIDVVIHKNSMLPNVHGSTNGKTRRFSLSKIN